MARVGLVQLAVDAAEPVSDRLERAQKLAERAAVGADLVILPELWPSGAFDIELGLAHAQPIDGPFPTSMSLLAARTGTWIHAGSFIEVDAGGTCHNTSLVFRPDGSLAAKYRKIHLFGFDGFEAAHLTAGRDLVVVETPLGMTGLATCYDLRFPELFRALTDLGATAVLLTSGWPTSRIRRWTLLAQARAVENQAWMIACNETGRHGGTELGGRSIVVDPWGEPVAEAGQGEQVLLADVDPGLPAAVRESFPVLRDRRLR